MLYFLSKHANTSVFSFTAVVFSSLFLHFLGVSMYSNSGRLHLPSNRVLDNRATCFSNLSGILRLLDG